MPVAVLIGAAENSSGRKGFQRGGKQVCVPVHKFFELTGSWQGSPRILELRSGNSSFWGFWGFDVEPTKLRA